MSSGRISGYTAGRRASKESSSYGNRNKFAAHRFLRRPAAVHAGRDRRALVPHGHRYEPYRPGGRDFGGHARIGGGKDRSSRKVAERADDRPANIPEPKDGRTQNHSASVSNLQNGCPERADDRPANISDRKNGRPERADDRPANIPDRKNGRPERSGGRAASVPDRQNGRTASINERQD